MTTVAKDSRVRKPRPPLPVRHFLGVAPTASCPGLLTIERGKGRRDYFVHLVPADFGRGFRLEGFTSQLVEGEPRDYHVNLRGPESTCECKGFLRWGLDAGQGKGCKHVEALQGLVDQGKL